MICYVQSITDEIDRMERVTFVADSPLCGFVGIAHLIQPYDSQPYAYLENIFVLDGYRGQGVGSKLLWHVIDLADAFDWELRLKVKKDNQARTLYERKGFCFHHNCLFGETIWLARPRQSEATDA